MERRTWTRRIAIAVVFAALIPVVRGAGGVITDWQGKDAIGAQSIVATTSQALHDEVIRRLNPR